MFGNHSDYDLIDCREHPEKGHLDFILIEKVTGEEIHLEAKAGVCKVRKEQYQNIFKLMRQGIRAGVFFEIEDVYDIINTRWVCYNK